MMRRIPRRGALATPVIAVLAACGRSRNSEPGRYLTEQGGSLTSPGGEYVITLEAAPDKNGVQMSVPVISEVDGAEVFRADREYSHRHGVGVRWSDDDTVWVLSSDIGDSRIDRQPDGQWVRTPDGANPWKDE